MNNLIVLDEIEKWNIVIDSMQLSFNEIGATSIGRIGYDHNYIKEIYHIAFFKIYVKFEIFITDLFIHYCLGNKSNNNYSPKRKLDFTEREQLESILKSSKSSFIDYMERIENTSKYIFEENDNPFSLLQTVADYKTNMNEMKVIRNLIAHESKESKTKYIKTVLGGNNFIPVQDFLLTKRRGKSKTNYSVYVDTINEMSQILLSPPL